MIHTCNILTATVSFQGFALEFSERQLVPHFLNAIYYKIRAKFTQFFKTL